jgi:hypothetical protein
MPPFTVCCLFYGDYPGLATRLLSSLARPAFAGKFELRVGMNACSPAMLDAIRAGAHALPPATPLHFDGDADNRLKYPVMRSLLRVEGRPLAPLVMWFDDDSFVRPDAPDDWFDRVAGLFAGGKADMVGSVYQIGVHPNQRRWVKAQPWYGGKPPVARYQFATGGWWAARSDLLLKHDWPVPEIRHRGGDVMLGELCRQQGYLLRHFNTGVAVNADDAGRESKSRRRGHDETPVGISL